MISKKKELSLLSRKRLSAVTRIPVTALYGGIFLLTLSSQDEDGARSTASWQHQPGHQ